MADQAVIEKLKCQIASIESAGLLANQQRGDACSRKRKGASTREDDLTSAEDALRKIIALVNAADRSEIAIRERLHRAEFAASAIDEAVERAKSFGFIDDMRYAEVLIRSRLSQGKGIPGIERELKSQGIDILDVPGWPEEFEADDEAEFDRAIAFLKARPPRSKNLREGAYRKLVSKGYSSSVASSAARAWCDAVTRG